MPTLAEDELTEEQKRQALLEDLYGEESRLPQSAIPADNVSFTNGADGRIQVDVPEGYAPPVERPMIGDEQYQNELARAQRGNGFIAADVSNNGELLQGAVDPNYRTPEQLIIEDKLATSAKRFKGQQMYASLIKGGASPAEAIRLAGADMFAANPAGNVSAVLHSQPKLAPLQKMVQGKVPPNVRAEEANIVARLNEARRGLRGKNVAGVTMPLDEMERAALEKQVADLESSRVRLLSDPRYNPNVDQVGYARIRGGMEVEPIQRPKLSEPAAAVAPQVAKADTKEMEANAVREQFRSGKLSRAEAEKMLKKLGYE